MSGVGIVGTTTWGITLGVMLAQRGHTVSIWARDEDEAAAYQSAREHRFLPGISFPEGLTVTASAEAAIAEADIVLVVVPSTSLRDNMRRLAPALRQARVIVSATKGIEAGRGLRPSEQILEELGPGAGCPVGALSGPNLAPEIAQGKASSATVAFEDPELAAAAQEVLTSELFRVYTSQDVTGVELGGALKNIIAIGAGIIDGLGLGDNAKAAFLTRGLAEITRLGVAMGARAETFAGLSGLGDLVATCFSGLSRNRRVGEELARGRKLAEIRAGMSQTAEGVPTTRAAVELAARCGVEMPITELTGRVLFDDLDPREAMDLLMRRAPMPETGARR